jgi:hypothetical protein
MQTKDGYHTFIDAYTHGNPTRFINQSCAPNSVAMQYRDQTGRSRFLFQTLFRIDAGTQVTSDFGGDIVKLFPQGCLCGVAVCRSRGYGDLIEQVAAAARKGGFEDKWHAICMYQTTAAAIKDAYMCLIEKSDGVVCAFLHSVLSGLAAAYVGALGEAVGHADRAPLEPLVPILLRAQETLPRANLWEQPPRLRVRDCLDDLVEFLTLPHRFPAPADRRSVLKSFLNAWQPPEQVPYVWMPPLLTLYLLADDYALFPPYPLVGMSEEDRQVLGLLSDGYVAMLDAEDPLSHDIEQLDQVQALGWEEPVHRLAPVFAAYLAYINSDPCWAEDPPIAYLNADAHDRAWIFLRRIDTMPAAEPQERAARYLHRTRDNYTKEANGYVPPLPDRDLRSTHPYMPIARSLAMTPTRYV